MLESGAVGKRQHLQRKDAEALFAHAWADATVFGARDAALIALLNDGGLLDDELTRLELRDLDAAARTVRLVREGAVVHAPLSQAALRALERWLAFRGTAPGGLIHPLERPARIVRKRISRGLVHDVIRRRSVGAGVERSTPGEIARSRHTAFRCPAAARFLSRQGHSMRTALTGRLDRLAAMISGADATARSLAWSAVTVEELGAADVPAGIGRRQLNEMRTALYGVLREAVIGGELRAEDYATLQRQDLGAARRSR